MEILMGFWSYAQSDDKVNNGKIALLAKHISQKYERTTGKKIDLFIDKERIWWGEEWQKKIDKSLDEVAFFVAVITPNYFKRPQCRRELEYFARRGLESGSQGLILPLIYTEVPDILDDLSTDGLVQLVRKFQWVSWGDLRYSETTSSEYEDGVFDIVSKLIQTTRETSNKPILQTTVERVSLELLSVVEMNINLLPTKIKDVSVQIINIFTIFNNALYEVRDQDGKKVGHPGNLILYPDLAERFKKATDEIWKSANHLSRFYFDMDIQFRDFISQAAEKSKEDAYFKKELCSFFISTRRNIFYAKDIFKKMEKLVASSEKLSKKTKELEPVITKQNRSLTILLTTEILFDEWLSLLDQTKIDC